MTIEALIVTLFDPPTGRIEGELRVPGFMAAATLALPSVYNGRVNGATHYIDPTTREPAERPDMVLTVTKTTIAADGVDEMVATGIPPGAFITLGAVREVVDDGEMVFTTVCPAVSTLRVERFPYKPVEIAIHAY